MIAVVVDASAVMEYLLQTPRAELLAQVLHDSDAVSLHVPALCDVEVAGVLRRGLLARKLDEPRAGEAMLDYLDLPITRHGHTSLLARMLHLRGNFSAFDAAYVSLAERLGAELLTADSALAQAARAHTSLAVRNV